MAARGAPDKAEFGLSDTVVLAISPHLEVREKITDFKFPGRGQRNRRLRTAGEPSKLPPLTPTPIS